MADTKVCIDKDRLTNSANLLGEISISTTDLDSIYNELNDIENEHDGIVLNASAINENIENIVTILKNINNLADNLINTVNEYDKADGDIIGALSEIDSSIKEKITSIDKDDIYRYSEEFKKEVVIYSNPQNLTDSKLEFIESIIPGAISTYEKYGVLPSLTLAQAILESGWGTCSIGNNIFGIKAGDNWTGKTTTTQTQEQTSSGSAYSITAAFRDYDSITESIEDHGKLLTNDRYKNVISSTNYKDACYAVKNAGYATDVNYSSKLINIIETYGLDQWDTIKSI